MTVCDHTITRVFLFQGARGTEWCPVCGAIRVIRFTNPEAGSTKLALEWEIPQVSNLTFSDDIEGKEVDT